MKNILHFHPQRNHKLNLSISQCPWQNLIKKSSQSSGEIGCGLCLSILLLVTQSNNMIENDQNPMLDSSQSILFWLCNKWNDIESELNHTIV